MKYFVEMKDHEIYEIFHWGYDQYYISNPQIEKEEIQSLVKVEEHIRDAKYDRPNNKAIFISENEDLMV